MIVLLLCLFVLVSVLSYIEDYLGKYKVLAYSVLTLILICVAAFKPIGCDNDSINYEYSFKNYDAKEVILNFEFSYRWLCSIISKISNSVRPIFIIYAIIGVSVKMCAFRKYSEMWFLCVVIYLGYYYLLHDLTQIRASIASGIFLLSIKSLAEGKKWQYFFMICIALFFHYSSLLLFPLLLINNKGLTNLKKYILALFVPIGYIIYFLHVNLVATIPLPYISDKIEIYQILSERGIMGDEINVFNMVFLVEILVYLFLLLKYDLIIEYNKYLPIMIKIMGLSIFSFLIFATLPVLAFRMYELYGIVNIILFTNIYYVIQPRLLSKSLIIVMAIILLCITIFYTDLIH
jgi:hypothetical protein